MSSRASVPAGRETSAPGESRRAPADVCDVCGSAELQELRCKVICRNCRTILRTCADLD